MSLTFSKIKPIYPPNLQLITINFISIQPVKAKVSNSSPAPPAGSVLPQPNYSSTKAPPWWWADIQDELAHQLIASIDSDKMSYHHCDGLLFALSAAAGISAGSDPNLAQFDPNFDQMHVVFKSTYPELCHLCHSPENGTNRASTENCGGDVKILNCHSPESRGFRNFGSNLSGDSNNRTTRSVTSPPNSSNSSIRNEFVDQKIKLGRAG
ncbi:hypothetical protein CASFOL_006346 [Castilleja foliolosa]|uniref:Uncharacterized protein n=1 Tax=Castilleja foliolosa TaxID=1961234 RepID=A0ABD3E642_9LAMI